MTNPNHSNDLDEWLKRFFLDPFTSYLDQIEFRIDLYETDQSIIIEAFLPQCDPSTVSIYVEKNHVTIEAYLQDPRTLNSKSKHVRKISLPFNVVDLDINASMTDDILEVYISKHLPGSGKNRSIPVL